jgi:hypothetical protein
MANVLAMTPLMDAEMIVVRRSERIAKIQKDKQIAKELGKHDESKTKKEIKPKQAITKKRATQKTCKARALTVKKTMDIFLTAQDMSQIKIKHLFTLIKRYCPSEERGFKYSILQTILKSYKQIGIQNTLHDLSTHMPKVVQYLSVQYNIIAVQDALNSMFAFPELMLSSQTPQEIKEFQGLDDLVGMMASTHITASAKDDDISALFARCSLT